LFPSFLVLNVGANNATCRLFNDFATPGKTTPQKLFFVHVNVDTLFADTSIETLHQNGKLKSGGPEDGKHAIVHYRFGQTLLFVENEVEFNFWFPTKQWQLDSEFVECKICECREYSRTRFRRISC
jgi:hypothetical protein